MFRCIEMFFAAMTLICTLLNVLPLRCVSINNQKCKIRPEIINFNNNEPSFFFLIIL